METDMPNIKNTVAIALSLVLLGSSPAIAQANWQGANGGWHDNGSARSNGGWDREAFWRDAPTDLRQRIDFVQRRIDSGVRDGTLTRREGRELNGRLNSIRREARRGYGNDGRRDSLQSQLDDLSRQVRWQRRDGDSRYGNRNNISGDRSGYNGNGIGNREDRFATQYDASRYYRDDPRYTERPLSYSDEVYRGSDGRYYCKRNDGTTGLIVGAIGGGVLGNVVDGGRNRVGGTLIGGALGALLGKSIDQNSGANSDVRCR